MSVMMSAPFQHTQCVSPSLPTAKPRSCSRSLGSAAETDYDRVEERDTEESHSQLARQDRCTGHALILTCLIARGRLSE